MVLDIQLEAAVQYAYLGGLLRTLLIIGVVIFVLRLISRMRQAQQMQQQMRNDTNNQRRATEEQQRTVHDNGKVRVEYTQNQNRQGGRRDNDDDYVDYEIVE